MRLKSCYGKYLHASDEEFLLGVTGRKVAQALPRKLDSSVEWEPIRDGMQVKLKTRRNSINHDVPHRHHDWILWEVDVVEIRPESPPKEVLRSESLEQEEDFSSSAFNLRFPGHVSSASHEDSPRKSEGRFIYYYVADDDGDVHEAIEGPSFLFKGHGLEQLTQLGYGLDVIVLGRS
ncbi:hypothetical protein BUALT_Bualt15G0090100 [Buddleja alternifolia]|uniref:DUF569 domain-containing protein n=1 Tax=Buddleja alternifolia TaxID=168488 RepID=A0AAV6WJ19_9LAMI|nr:hypothetical protein BUALT_Bualt15G0090100 [Buddleja alternifolia]